MENGIVDLVSFDQGFAWRHWAVWYFLLVGSAVGASLIAFITTLRDENDPKVRSALFAAAALGIAAPFPLLADLHQPARFMHFYLGAAPDSIMWWGSWFLPGFVAGLAALVLLYSPFASRFTAYRRYVWYWTTVFAIAVLAYTAGEMTIVRARPVWHDLFFPVILTLSALVSGSGAVTIVSAARGEVWDMVRRMLGLGSLLFVAGILTWIATGLGKSGTFTELAVQDHPVSLLFVMTGACGVGVAALAATRVALLNVVAGIFAVLGALVFRWELFMGAQAQPKTEAGFLPYSLLADGDALAGLFGTVGLLVVIVVILSLILVDEGNGEDARPASHTTH